MSSNDRVIRYEVSTRDHLRLLWPMFLWVVVLVATPVVLSNKFGPDAFWSSFAICAIGFSVYAIPLTILHFKYSIINSGMNLEYDLNQKSLTVNEEGVSRTIRNQDVSRVEVVVTRSLASGQLLFAPWDAYGFGRIILESGESVIVTTLLIRDLHWPLTFEPTKREIRLFCWPG